MHTWIISRGRKVNTLRIFLILPSLIFQLSIASAQHRVSSPVVKIDFSYAGYKGGGIAPPTVPVILFVRPTGGDDTKLLQSAIDYIGKLPVQKDGFRGALQLREGTYKVSGKLIIDKSGVAINGAADNRKTVIVASGTERRTLIEIGTVDSVSPRNAVQVTNTLVPAGSLTLTVDNLKDLKIGDRVVITRPGSASWISDIGMNKDDGMFSDRRGMIWPAASRDLRWDRLITAVNAVKKEITLDAPITTALEQLYGGGTVRKVTGNELIRNTVLEGITIESEFENDNRSDEEHSWIGIQLNYSEDTWISNVVARHFVSSAIRVGPRARRVTVQNCASEQPVSEIGGYRRHSFLVEGQQVLVNNCRADSGVNDFAAGFCAGGPNVFLNCKATRAFGASGSFESWASGILYENVNIEGAGLRLTFDFDRSQGGGWTAANSVIWNCTAKDIEALGPQAYPNLVVNSKNSLYEKQLNERLGNTQNAAQQVADGHKKTSSNPREFTAREIPADHPAAKQQAPTFSIVNGRFVMGDKVVWGGTTGDQFWRGQPFPGGELNSGICITRWVPGRVGAGLTEDLPALARNMASQGTSFYQAITGLWYDRRRDDHSTLQRKDGMVWAPFLEMPWLRTGKGKAWDGLSLFDLTTFNPWYFKRFKEFAGLCDENGLILYNSIYDTHNLLEYLTHWVDHPFRPANNINETGLPEPPPVEPWARFHGGNQFYDANNPALVKLHRAYIFHVLDELGSANNVIFNLGGEFSGPLEFQRFFMRTVSDWEKQRNRNVRLVLNTSKDITDSILADRELAKQVDVIDTRYWQYRPAGTFSIGDDVWAPPGGTNRSFREMVGESFILQSGVPFSTQQEQMYRQVREYTDRFPDKAVVSVYNDVSPIPSLMAGGAQVVMGNQKDGWAGRTTFSSFVKKYLAAILMNMKPKDGIVEDNNQNWCLIDDKNTSLLIYSLSGSTITLSKDFSGSNYTGVWFDPLAEKVIPFEDVQAMKKGATIKKPSRLNWMLLLQAKN